MSEAWPAAAEQLRTVLLRAGCPEADGEQLLDDLAKPFAAIERERGCVEADLLWGLGRRPG